MRELPWSRKPLDACVVPSKHLRTLHVGKDGCMCIAIAPDGRTIAAACMDEGPVFPVRPLVCVFVCCLRTCA